MGEVAGLKTQDASLQTQIDADGVAGVNRGTEVTANKNAIAAIVADYVTSKEVTDSVKGKSYLAYCETSKRKNLNTASRRGCGCACDFLTGDMNCPAGICTVDPSKKKFARLKMTPKESSVCFLTSTRADNPHSSHDAECLIEAMADGWYLQATSYDNDDYTACEARCMEFS